MWIFTARSRRSAVARILAAVLLCGILGAAAPSVAADAPKEIVVGAALPLTGLEARIGTYFKAAYELVTKEYNDNGGLQLRTYGKKIPVRLIIYDDKSDPATSRNLYERLAVQDHVDAFLGGYATDLIQAHTVVAQQYKIPYVNGGGAASDIYHRGFSTVFGLLASIQNLALTECDLIEAMQAVGKLPKPLKMAIVYENTAHGKDFVDGLQQRAKKKPGNYQIVMNEAFDLGGRDFTPLLQKVKAVNADAFMADAHLEDYITMQRQYKQAGLHHKFITYGARGPEKKAVETLGDGANYVVSAVWWNAKMREHANAAFLEKWKRVYPTLNPEWFAALPYETARTLYIAMTQAGTNDKAKIVDTLRTIDIVDTILPGGHIKFEKNGQSNAPFVVTENMPGGSFELIWPKSEMTGQPVLPVP